MADEDNDTKEVAGAENTPVVPPAVSPEKTEVVKIEEAAPRTAPTLNEHYGIHTSGGNNQYVNFSAHLYSDPWKKESAEQKKDGQPLYKSFAGRVGTRLISRGIFGAAFFTMGNIALRSWDPVLTRMNPEESPWIHRGFNKIMDSCDYVFGKPIAAATEGVYSLLGNPEAKELGQKAVTGFRSKVNVSAFGMKKAMSGLSLKQVPISAVSGRSLGEEMVRVTFDFAMGSVGDAFGRKLVGVFDPNVHKDWLENGHIHFGKMAKSMAKSAWEIASYNQMEDWVAALPYVYQMRGQRAIQSKYWPGSKIAMDHNMSGFRFDKESGDITGSYLPVSVMDLQFRFMGYNFYTLMFRDVYNHVANELHQWKEHDYPLHISLPQHPVEAVEHAIGETIKYTAKSFMKSMLYMAPAVPFFWATRAPIMHKNGFFLADDQENGVVTHKRTVPVRREGKDGKDISFWAKEGENGGLGITTTKNADILSFADMRRAHPKEWKINTHGHNFIKFKDGDIIVPYLNGKPIHPEWFSPDFNPYDQKYANNLLEKILFPIGNAASHATDFLAKEVFQKVADTSFMSDYILPKMKNSGHWGKVVDVNPRIFNTYNFAGTYINAAMSYTPYMIAKYETANHIDMPLFDLAAYRFLDGVHHFKWNDIKEGVQDMASVVVRNPVSEGTLAEADKPRGLINSTYESSRQNELKQQQLREERLAKAQEALANKPKPGGWSAYAASRAQAKENGVPDGVTVH